MQVTGLQETIQAIDEVAQDLIKQAEITVRLAGQAYANDVKAIAPYLTGDYRRSIHVEKIIEEGGKFYAIVGTNLPQGPRLEWGFYDMTDSLGRHYYQLPLPHFRPPLDTEMDKYVAIMQGTFDEALFTNFSEGISLVKSAFSASPEPSRSSPSVISGLRPDLTAGWSDTWYGD